MRRLRETGGKRTEQYKVESEESQEEDAGNQEYQDDNFIVDGKYGGSSDEEDFMERKAK